jgi:hypothetical protein
MRQRGHRFSFIDEPVDQALGQRLSDRERKVAVDDVRCTRSSGWRDISFEIERRLQLRSLQENRAEFAEKYRNEEEMLATAAAQVAMLPR